MLVFAYIIATLGILSNLFLKLLEIHLQGTAVYSITGVIIS
jgi:hypothetical protein